jgi:hypothetical protein
MEPVTPPSPPLPPGPPEPARPAAARPAPQGGPARLGFVGGLGLAAALAAGAAGALYLARGGGRPAPIGWAVAGDEDAEPVHVRAGDLVRADERIGGTVAIGAVRLELAPGAEVRLVSATAVELLAGSFDATSVGERAFAIAFPATVTAAPVLLPDRVVHVEVALTPAGAEVAVRAGLVGFGGLRLAPGDRALARPGAGPEKR